MRRFEVQHWTECDGWRNTWIDDNNRPIRFGKREDARRNLEKFLMERQDYSPEDFRIAEVK